MSKIRASPNFGVVMSYRVVATALKTTMREVRRLVQDGQLDGVQSEVFLIPAITSKSLKAFQKKKKKELALMYQREETLSLDEIAKLLKISKSGASSLVYRSPIRKVGHGEYNKESVLEYIKTLENK